MNTAEPYKTSEEGEKRMKKITYDKKSAWEILYSRYEGMQAKAMQLLSAEVGYRVTRDPGVYSRYVLP